MQQRIPWWTRGDWDAFFGLGTNSVLNILVLTSLMVFVLKLPDSIVFGRIVPAVGLSLIIGNIYYAHMARRLARQENRLDVTALPYGPSVPHMFIVVLVIMLPVYIKTNDPVLAWQAGLAWAFIEGIIEALGGVFGRSIRKYTPRAAMLGTLAGISIAFISMRPAFQTWDLPWIGFISLGIVLAAWFGNARLPGGLPAGLFAIIVGTVLGWVFGVMKPGPLIEAVQNFSPRLPFFEFDPLIKGFAQVAPLLVTAIPFGIYNFMEAIDNVESAAAAGDDYNPAEVCLVDGIGTLAGVVMGSPFPTAVYIGHPGWKAIGGRIGYSLATGIMVAVLCFFGIVPILLRIIPLVAILPILIYIGALIGAQAFQATPRQHAPAVVLALLPHIAAWGQVQIDGALAAAGTNAAQVGLDKLANNGVLYQGMQWLGGGAIIGGMVLGAIGAFLIDRRYLAAAGYAVAAAVLSFFGFIHGTQLGWAQQPVIALGYLLLAAVCVGFAQTDRGQALAPAPVAGGK
ncbi:MAG: regulator [Armatimonadota bacterium]|nr:regulator [Armatimonadota bacterium]MDR7550665.1 regulator [Armatimonadota bacterium]